VRYLVYVFLLWNYDAIFAVVVYFRMNIIIIPIVLFYCPGMLYSLSCRYNMYVSLYKLRYYSAKWNA
jgi:hypothetical protein